MLPYESQQFCAKLVLSQVKQPEAEFRHSFVERPTLNAQATSEHEPGLSMPYSTQTCRHELSEGAEEAASPVSVKGEGSNLGAGIVSIIVFRHGQA